MNLLKQTFWLWSSESFHNTKRAIWLEWHYRQRRVKTSIFSNQVTNSSWGIKVVTSRRRSTRNSSWRSLALLMMMVLMLLLRIGRNLHFHVGWERKAQPVIIAATVIIHGLHLLLLVKSISLSLSSFFHSQMSYFFFLLVSISCYKATQSLATK